MEEFSMTCRFASFCRFELSVSVLPFLTIGTVDIIVEGISQTQCLLLQS